jgi:hypothetical protein
MNAQSGMGCYPRAAQLRAETLAERAGVTARHSSRRNVGWTTLSVPSNGTPSAYSVPNPAGIFWDDMLEFIEE